MMKLKKLLHTSVISVLLVGMLTGLMPAFHTEADAAWKNGKQIVLTDEQIQKAVDWAKYTLNSDSKRKYNHDNMTWCDTFVQDCYTEGAGLQNYNTAAGNARARGLVAQAAGRLHTDMDPPVGAIVYWEWGKPMTREKNGVIQEYNFGHCGICIGNRKVINVRSAGNGYMSTNTISEINNWTSSKHDGWKYMGWSAPEGYVFASEISITESYLDKCKWHRDTCVKIQVIKDNAPVWSIPCSDATDKRATQLQKMKKGSYLNATEIWCNTQNNLWYKVEINGRTGYIYGENTNAVGISDDVLTSDSTIKLATRTPKKGSSCRISGTYKTNSATIISVKGVLDSTKFSNPSNQRQTVTVIVKGRSLDIQASNINKKLKFGELPAGKGSLSMSAVFEANYIDGTVMKTKQFPEMKLHTLEFTVK